MEVELPAAISPTLEAITAQTPFGFGVEIDLGEELEELIGEEMEVTEEKEDRNVLLVELPSLPGPPEAPRSFGSTSGKHSVTYSIGNEFSNGPSKKTKPKDQLGGNDGSRALEKVTTVKAAESETELPVQYSTAALYCRHCTTLQAGPEVEFTVIRVESTVSQEAAVADEEVGADRGNSEEMAVTGSDATERHTSDNQETTTAPIIPGATTTTGPADSETLTPTSHSGLLTTLADQEGTDQAITEEREEQEEEEGDEEEEEEKLIEVTLSNIDGVRINQLIA